MISQQEKTDVAERRDQLNVQVNPDTRRDYITTLGGEVRGLTEGTTAVVELRYVPDGVILKPQSFLTYLEYLAEQPWESLEDMATTILDDINNEVVARCVEICVETRTINTDGPHSHRVFLQDSQPNWSNPDLLRRLQRH